MAVRPRRVNTLMDVARVMSQRATCTRAQVGTVIARGGRILSSGYNGAPAGMAHCDHTCTCESPSRLSTRQNGLDHHPGCPLDKVGCTVAIHAEANAIVWAARVGVATEGAQLYTTHMPCLACAQLIINAGIVSVMYETDYRVKAGLELLMNARIPVIKL